MNRRRRWLLALLAFLALVAFGLRLPSITAGLIVSRLSSSFERPAGLERVRFELSPPRVVIEKLWVGGLTPEASPFLEVARVTVRPSLTSLWGPRLVLEELRLDGLTLRINAFSGGGDDIPKPRRKGQGGEVRIGRLSIVEGAFILNHRRVPLHLDLPDFRGGLMARDRGVLAGRLAFGPGILRFSDRPMLPVGTEMSVRLQGSLLSVDSARLTATNTDLAYTGKLRIAARPVGRFELDGPVDLAVLDRHVMRTGLGLKGASRYTGTLFVDGSRLSLKGRVTGTAGEFDAIPVPRYAGDLDWDGDGVHIRELQVEALGGSGVMDVEVPPGQSTATWAGSVQGVDGEALFRAIFDDVGPFGLGTSATGRFSIAWPRGRFRAGLSGQTALSLDERPDGREPLRGHLEWSARDGIQHIDRAELRTPYTQVRIQGRIGLDDSADMTLSGESADLAATDALGQRLRRALGAAEARRAGFAGSGVFQGHWGGTLQVPVFEGRFTGQDLGYLGVVWGRAEWVGRADPFEVVSHSLVIRRPGGELWVDGRSELGEYGQDDELDVSVRFEGWPARDFIGALDWDLDLDGALTGDAIVRGRRSAPLGTVRVTGPAGRYYGIPFAGLEVTSQLRGPLSQAVGRASVGGGRVSFRGTLTDDGQIDGAAEAVGVDVGDVLPPVVPSAPWGGNVSGTAALRGTLDRPWIVGRLVSKRLFVGDEGLGAVDISLAGAGDGRVALEGHCRSARVELALQGSVGAAEPYPATLQVSVRDTSLDPFVRVAYPRLPSVIGVIASGELQLSGPLLDPRSLVLEVKASDARIQLPEYPIRNRAPVELAVRDGRLELSDLLLAGEGTDLAIEGSAALLDDGPLNLTVRGAADLRALSGITRHLRGRGQALLATTVSGTRDDPRVSGTLQLAGAGVRARGFPHGIDGVRGTLRFTESAAQFSGVTGTLGGGSVELSGQVGYAGGELGSFEIDATGRKLVFRYPEGLRSLVDADLRFLGDATHQWVTGSVDVRQASWTRRYDLASELLSTREQLEERVSLDEGVRFDIDVRAPGTLRIDNNLATLQARAELKLQGSYEQPVVLGRADVDHGRVYFQGNTYVIRSGSIDFSNPQKIDPVFDIEAETQLRSYRVTLKVAGTLERVSPTLTSDPPLSAVQILSLLAGADEAAVASLTRVQTDQANLAAAGAATLAAGRISEEIGLERGAERLFGLNRFSIDPSVIKGGVTNPSARLTVGKRLVSDLSVLYSVDLRGTEERVLSVEYDLSDRLSLLFTRTENPTENAFDIRFVRSH